MCQESTIHNKRYSLYCCAASQRAEISFLYKSMETITGILCLQQQAKHQGSPWKGPGLKPCSPRVSRLPGFEPRLLEPEEHAWDSSSDVPPASSSPFVGHDDTSSEARAAPKEADSESGAQSQVESAGGSHGSQVKKSKGSAQKHAGSSRGLTQGSGVQRGEGGRGCAASTARKGVTKVHRSQSFAVSIPRQVFSTMRSLQNAAAQSLQIEAQTIALLSCFHSSAAHTV